jgi:hypothetical protein
VEYLRIISPECVVVAHDVTMCEEQAREPVRTCCILSCVIQNSTFISVNTTKQVKVITKFIYISVNYDMFRPLLGHHQVYFCVLRS